MGKVANFCRENKKALWMLFGAALGTGFGWCMSDDEFRKDVVQGKVGFSIGPAVNGAKPASVSGVGGSKTVDYSHMDYYGRAALRDEQEYQLRMQKMKNDHELEMAKIIHAKEGEVVVE